MAALLRVITYNAITKIAYVNSASITQSVFNRKFNSHSVKNVIQMFISNRETKNQASDFDIAKEILAKSLKQDILPPEESKRANEITKNLLTYIVSAESEKDLEFLTEYLKKRSSAIVRSDLSQYLVGSNLMKLLYVLDKTDKSLELYKDESTHGLFINRETILILMTKLAEQRRYVDILFVYEDYLKNITSSIRQPVLNNHLDIFTKALFLVNPSDAGDKIKSLLENLDKTTFELSASSTIYLFLLIIKQNDLDLAKQLLDKISTYKFKIPEFLNSNLKSILHSKSNQLDSSFKEIESLTQNRKIFPLTLRILSQSITKNNDMEASKRLKELKAKISKENRPSRSDFVNFADYLSKPKEKPVQQVIKDKSESSKIKPAKTVIKDKLITIAPIETNSKPIQISSSETINTQLGALFLEEKYADLVALFEDNLINSYRDVIPIDDLKLVTGSLHKMNSKGALNKAKRIFNKINNSKPTTVIDDCSKLHMFLLALNQNEPYFAVGFITLTNIDKSSQTIYKNLKAAALAKLNKIEEAFNELKSVTNLPKNIFTNDGFVFQFTLDCLKQASQQSELQSNEFSSFVVRLNSQDRISKLDLIDFICVKNVIKAKNQPALVEPIVVKETGRNIAQEMNTLYHECKFEQVIELFEMNSITEWSREESNILSKSCFKANLDIQRIKNIINLIKQNNLVLSFNSLVDFFLKFIQFNEPLYALEFLADNDQNEIFKNTKPSIYKNLLAIGFFSINKVEIAIPQIESLFQTALKPSLKYKYDGRIFPITMNHLKWSLNNTTNIETKQKLEQLIDKCNREKRLCTIDLEAVSSI